MAELHGWLVYKQKDAEVNRGFIMMLTEAAAAINLSLQLIYEEDLSIGISGGLAAIQHPIYDSRNLDFVLMRTINQLLTKQFEAAGIRCFNSSSVASLCNDKAQSYQYVSRLGIEMLDSWFITSRTFNPEKIPFCRFPMVLKQSDGRGGKEVYLVHSTEEIEEILMQYPHKQFVLQQFAEQPGKDLRVFVLGGEIIGAVMRTSATSFKANYTLGGKVAPYILFPEEAEIVHRISAPLKADFIGIDFLLNSSGQLVFNEIEDVVGCRSLYSTTDVDAAALYMRHIKKTLKKG